MNPRQVGITVAYAVSQKKTAEISFAAKGHAKTERRAFVNRLLLDPDSRPPPSAVDWCLRLQILE